MSLTSYQAAPPRNLVLSELAGLTGVEPITLRFVV